MAVAEDLKNTSNDGWRETLRKNKCFGCDETKF